MPLTTLDFTQLVENQVSAIQAQVPNFQFPEGSVNLAIVESNAGMGLWLQGINIQLLALTRAASSTGTDLDSWMADFGFKRNPAASASGLVTFSRIQTTSSATIGVGTIVQTSVGLIQFEVYEDDTNPYWYAPANGYVVPIGIGSASVPVIALVAGTQGNVVAGAIDQAASFTSFDSISNAAAFTNGVNSESDSSFRARFIVYINSLSLGTLLAYQAAITDGTPKIFYNIAENVNISGGTQLGFVTVIIDDGSGNPPSSLIALISEKINNVRALAIQYGVYPVVVLTVNISVTVTIDPLVSPTDVMSNINTAISTYLSTLQIGQTVIYTKLYQVIYDSNSNIIEVSNLLVNGGSVDIVTSFKQRAYLGTLTITVT